MSLRILALSALLPLAACQSSPSSGGVSAQPTNTAATAPAESGAAAVAQGTEEASSAAPLYPGGRMQDLTSGSTSGINELRLALIQGPEHWAAFWAEHCKNRIPAPDPLEVNFEEFHVLALVLGERTSGGYGVRIDSCEGTDHGLLIEASEQRPEPGVATTMALTSPYHFTLVPRGWTAARGLELRLSR